MSQNQKTAIDFDDGRIAILRSFEYDIAARLARLGERFPVEVVGTAVYGLRSYPIFQISVIDDPANPFVHLSGIVHGDEEAGGKAILEFHERGLIESYRKNFNFISYPCVNGSGYETATLQAMNGYHPESRFDKNTGNINRSFNGALPQQEALILEAALSRGPERYLVAIDMHESPPYYTDETYSPADAPKGAWMYESCRGEHLRIGRLLTDSLPDHLEACDWPVIYHDKNDGGVIAFSADTTGHAEYTVPTSFDGYIFERYSDHTFTTETPTGWSLEKRIEAQLHFLTKILDTYIQRQIRPK